MGVTESTHIDEKYCGFRVYKIIPGGPLENSGIKELEDFIIPPADLNIKKQPFYEYIRINSGKKIPLIIYSLATRTFSDLEITPGLNEKGQGFLGATVRYENWSTADKNLLRVLRVRENSLANRKLGLIPGDDFIIAIRPDDEDIITLNKADVDPLSYFSEILSINKYKPIEFFIYNSKSGARYEKAILNDTKDEVLGCDVAYGKLHEFPKVNKRNQIERVSEGVIQKKNEDNGKNNNDGQTANESLGIIEIENKKKEDESSSLLLQEEKKDLKEDESSSLLIQEKEDLKEDVNSSLLIQEKIENKKDDESSCLLIQEEKEDLKEHENSSILIKEEKEDLKKDETGSRLIIEGKEDLKEHNNKKTNDNEIKSREDDIIVETVIDENANNN